MSRGTYYVKRNLLCQEELTMSRGTYYVKRNLKGRFSSGLDGTLAI